MTSPFDMSGMMAGTPAQAQITLGQDPMPDVRYSQYTPAQWQAYLQEKIQQHRTGSNPNAFLGIQKAVHALNSYDAQSMSPTSGELLGAEAKGVSEIPGQMLKGFGTMAGDAITGHYGKVLGDVLGGLQQTVKGTLQLPASAARAATGGDIPPYDELTRQAESYGSSAPMAALMASSVPKAAGSAARFAMSPVRGTAGFILQQIAKGFGRGAAEAPKGGGSFLPPDYAPFKPEPPEAGPAPQGVNTAQPVSDLPGQGKYLSDAPGAGRGFGAEGPPLKPVTPAMEALSKLTGGAEQVLPDAARMSAEVPPDAGEFGRVQGQKGMTFGPESTYSPVVKAAMLRLMGELTRQMSGGGETSLGIGAGHSGY